MRSESSSNCARQSCTPHLERLEPRQLASVSYVPVGRRITPSILSALPSYFGSNLPSGDYLIECVGGSMTYYDGAHPLIYSVNDYSKGDFGFKVVVPGLPRFDAPGLSVGITSSVHASKQSFGTYIKFRHHGSSKIGIEIYDNPIGDNAAGADGSPEFVLKERVVTPTTSATSPTPSAAKSAAPLAARTSAIAFVNTSLSPFSSTPIAGSSLAPDYSLNDPPDLLT